jgi:uncharacterized protein YjeT (DUF2065 family)
LAGVTRSIQHTTPGFGEEKIVYGIAFFGVVMVLISVLMVINPDNFSSGILKFSRMAYFHGFEIVSRVSFGSLFVAFSEQTLYPAVIDAFGYLMISVGIGLLIAGPSRHKQFAAWSARKFNRTFRPAGIASIVFGTFIVYAALNGP